MEMAFEGHIKMSGLCGLGGVMRPLITVSLKRNITAHRLKNEKKSFQQCFVQHRRKELQQTAFAHLHKLNMHILAFVL